MPEQLDAEQRNRLWEHGIHAENVFLNQLNFFLIFESLLLGGIISVLLSNKQPSGKFILLVIAIFGLLLAVFWLCVQFNQGYLFEKLKKRLKEVLPEYKETIRQREEARPWTIIILQFLGNLRFLGLSIPGLVTLVWLALLIYIAFS